jgi:hypothetical protein
MYIATVRQMFDPGKGLDPSPGTVHFEVVLARVEGNGLRVENIDEVWWSE